MHSLLLLLFCSFSDPDPYCTTNVSVLDLGSLAPLKDLLDQDNSHPSRLRLAPVHHESMRPRPPPSKTLHFFHRKHSLSSIPSESVCQDGASESHYTHLLQICLQQCKYIKTRKVFDEMPDRLLTHASRTCKAVHARSLTFGIASKGLLGNAILGFYARCGNVDFAKKAFDCLENKDVFAWNSVLLMYSSKGLLKQVVKSFGSMWNGRVIPNEFTFAMVLRGHTVPSIGMLDQRPCQTQMFYQSAC